ncbi:hypothetical protein OUZ56_028219 [Daphnia magna]|uniref:Uncharacterized protein n=1 Tax=Daphnia magna TaxID=35525 RepID=A0ABR0B370_9CRUS|nr:hypothetical protein OUZ56_028219 [Daphnia magna]
MSLKVTGVYFSASSAGPGPGKMKATIRAARHHPPPPSSLAPQPIHYVHHQQQQQLPSAGGRNASNGNNMSGSPAGNDQQPPVKSNKSGNRIISNNHHYSNHHHSHLHSQSLDYLHLNFEEKRQIIASSLSLVDFLHHPPAKIKALVEAPRPPSLLYIGAGLDVSKSQWKFRLVHHPPPPVKLWTLDGSAL